MMTPVGVKLELGQKWREIDPRFDRIVEITELDESCQAVRLNGRTWASLNRFNGKRGGYALEQESEE